MSPAASTARATFWVSDSLCTVSYLIYSARQVRVRRCERVLGMRMLQRSDICLRYTTYSWAGISIKKLRTVRRFESVSYVWWRHCAIRGSRPFRNGAKEALFNMKINTYACKARCHIHSNLVNVQAVLAQHTWHLVSPLVPTRKQHLLLTEMKQWYIVSPLALYLYNVSRAPLV